MHLFNKEGPVVAGEHYLIDPLSRVDIAGIDSLVERKKYFVLHAPRQTGKTSTLLALVDRYNATGKYRCVYVNVEAAQAEGENTDGVVRTVLQELGEAAKLYVDDDFVQRTWHEVAACGAASSALKTVLARWAEASPQSIVVMIDEIDALRGNGLLTVLRQIRSGYAQKPRAFPSSIVLCGVRDVRDYRLPSDGATKAGGSSFNIKADSLRLGDFTRADVECLLGQHTAETGQVFEPPALECLWDKTRGQPWLVNAVAFEACFRMADGMDRARPVTATMIERATERLIARRETHLDQLGAVLKEARVRAVVDVILAGDIEGRHLPTDDIDYVIDLGLVRRNGELQVANPIYREIIPRELTYAEQATMRQESAWYVQADGSLDVVRLLEAFRDFFRQNVEHSRERFEYRESGPQLLLQAFLHRVVNGGGLIEREYGIGRGRTDLLVRWPLADGFEPGKPVQLVVIELKVVREGRSDDTVTAEGLRQTVAWYRDHEWWWRPIKEGDEAFRSYYQRQYAARLGEAG